MSKMKTLFAVALVAMLAACATPRSKKAALVHEVDSAAVHDCSFVRRVEGNANYDGLFAHEIALKNAKTEAIEKAAMARATDVVWTKSSGSIVAANAYRCE